MRKLLIVLVAAIAIRIGVALIRAQDPSSLPQPMPLTAAQSEAAFLARPTVDNARLAAMAASRKLGANQRAQSVAKRVSPSLSAELEARKLKLGSPVFVRILKEERLLELWVKASPPSQKFTLFKSYPIHAMSGALGPKTREGDRQAPEGFYYVPRSRMHPGSTYHLAFNLGYPNSYDRSQKRTGSFLMVHGNEISVGCFAMSDAGIEEIYTVVDAALAGGQPFFRVHCFPFRMTTKKMAQAREAESEWIDFWEMLLPGYEAFESTKVPPNIEVKAGRYVVSKPSE